MPKNSASSYGQTRRYVAPYPPVQRGSGLSVGGGPMTDNSFSAVTGVFAVATGDADVQMGGLDAAALNSVSTSNATPNTEDVHIPRPQNKFMLFRREMCNRGIPELGALRRAADKSKIVAKLWDDLSEKQKEYWRAKAEVAKEEHRRQYPDYKYKPNRKGAKSRRRSNCQRKGNVSRRGCSKSDITDVDIPVLPETAVTSSAQIADAFGPARGSGFPKPVPVALPANWYYIAKGKRSQTQQKQIKPPYSDSGAKQSVTTQRPISTPGIQLPALLPMQFRTQEIYNESVDSTSSSSMHRSLGQDALLLQGFQYNRSSGHTKDLGSAFNGSTDHVIDHQGSTSSGINTYSLASGDERFNLPPKAWWDFVSPEESMQINTSTSSWNQSC